METTIQETATICKIDHDKKEIMVFEDVIRALLSVIGDGIYDFQSSSILYNYWYKNQPASEWQNEIIITFHEEAWGGISLERWKIAETKLEAIVNQKIGLDSYLPNPSHNQIRLDFDSIYEMGIYSL